MKCPPSHKHGTTSTCYGTHGCRCTPCRDNNAAAQTRYRKLRAYGRPTTDLIDAQPAREHVNMLRRNGFGQERIAELANVPNNVLRHLLYGTYGTPPAERIRTAHATALLAVQPDPELVMRRNPAGTIRRLQALAVQGWTFARLAAQLGVRTEAIHSYFHSETVTPNTHARIAALFDELWNQTPPQETRGQRAAATRMRTIAARKGWVGPLAWDDIDNDPKPPKADNPPFAASRAREELIRQLHAKRMSDGQIAAALGIRPRAVFRVRNERLGLPAWTKDEQGAAA